MSEGQVDEKEKQELVDKLKEILQEKLIDKENCIKSLEEQLKGQNGPTQNQQRQFQLGNGQRRRNPLQAAEILLKREYGDSFLFDKGDESIFIPPVFVSKHHATHHIQDEEMLSEIKKHFVQLSDDDWFKKELKAFFQDQKRKHGIPNNTSTISNAIINHDYQDWILRVKIKYLLHEELKNKNEDLRKIPLTMQHQTESFLKTCFERFSKQKVVSPSLNTILETMNNGERLKELVDKEIEKKILGETMKWFFELTIPQGKLVTSLDYDFVNHIKETVQNEENPSWFRDELERFLQEHSGNGINQKQLEIWIANIKQQYQSEIEADGPGNVIEWLDKVKDIRDDEEIEQWLFNVLNGNSVLLKDCVVLRSVDIKVKGLGAEFDIH